MDAVGQRVVVGGLPVRALHPLAHASIGIDDQRGMAPEAVAPAITQVPVGRQVVPVPGHRRETGRIAASQREAGGRGQAHGQGRGRGAGSGTMPPLPC